MTAGAASRRRTGPLLFVPARWQRVAFLTWLKRIHAWTGLWGALLFFGLGASGFLLNHRTQLKIDTGAPREVSSVELRVPATQVADAKRLDAWTKATFAVAGEGRAPTPEAPGPVALLGRTLPQAERLERVFNLVDGRLIVATVPGSGVVTVRRDAVGLLATLKNFHKGTGLGVAWILLVDTIAGALVTMSVTGVLLWSRLHGPRLAAAALASGCAIWAFVAAWSYVGV